MFCKAYDFLGRNLDRRSRCLSSTGFSHVYFLFYHYRFEDQLSESPPSSPKDWLWNGSKPESPGSCFWKRSKEVESVWYSYLWPFYIPWLLMRGKEEDLHSQIGRWVCCPVVTCCGFSASWSTLPNRQPRVHLDALLPSTYKHEYHYMINSAWGRQQVRRVWARWIRVDIAMRRETMPEHLRPSQKYPLRLVTPRFLSENAPAWWLQIVYSL